MSKHLKLALFLLVTSGLFLISGHLALAKADDLIIRNDGSIVLVMTKPVLSASSDKIQEVENAIGKIIQVAPAHAQNSVEVDPKPTKDQKINVTIKTEAKAHAPAKEEKRTVDQITAQGSDNKPVFSIKSNKSNQVTIKQGNIEASTPLPLTIDAKSKSVSTKVGNDQVKIQILPKDALKTAQDKGFTTPASSGNAPQSEKISLQAQNGEAVYKVSGKREEKLLNLFDFTSPVTVDISAQTGRTVRVSQPAIFNIIDFLSGR